MIKKQVSSLLFNKNRTVDDSVNTENLPDLTLTDLKKPSTEIISKPLDLTKQNPASELSPDTPQPSLPDSYQKAIQRAKDVLRIGKNLFSQLNK